MALERVNREEGAMLLTSMLSASIDHIFIFDTSIILKERSHPEIQNFYKRNESVMVWWPRLMAECDTLDLLSFDILLCPSQPSPAWPLSAGW